MGQLYSYTQPSSSDEYDITAFLQEEAAIYADEAQSTFSIGEPVSHPYEADDGIPITCYCGKEAALATSYTTKDPGRLYYTCDNRDDGDCHIWKWWDVAVTEEVREVQRQLTQLKDQGFESDQKLVQLQKSLFAMTKKSEAFNGYGVKVCLLVSALVFLGLALMFVSGRVSKK